MFLAGLFFILLVLGFLGSFRSCVSFCLLVSFLFNFSLCSRIRLGMLVLGFLSLIGWILRSFEPSLGSWILVSALVFQGLEEHLLKLRKHQPLLLLFLLIFREFQALEWKFILFLRSITPFKVIFYVQSFFLGTSTSTFWLDKEITKLYSKPHLK